MEHDTETAAAAANDWSATADQVNAFWRRYPSEASRFRALLPYIGRRYLTAKGTWGAAWNMSREDMQKLLDA